MASDEPRTLYTLDRDRTYHFVTFVLVVLAAVVVGLVLLLTPESGLAEFGSIAAGRGAQVAFFVVGLGPLLAWLRWMPRYVRRIVWLPATQEVELERLGCFTRKTLRLPPSAFVRVAHREGRADFPGTPGVDAPYRRLHVDGLPPLILDDQGTVHDARALEAILDGRVPDEALSPRGARRDSGA